MMTLRAAGPGLAVSLCVLGFAAAARAAPDEADPPGQGIDEMMGMSLEDLLKTPVSAGSKIETKQSEAPNVITLVTRGEMDAYRRQSMNDVLFSLPGFQPSQDYDRRTVTSRGAFEGWNNNHLLVLMDGLPINDNLYGSAYTWEITPLYFTKQMEVILGPGSALYGSNATNGVVSVKTLSAEDLKGKTLARFDGGTFGTTHFDVMSGAQGALVSGVIGFDRFQTDGNQYPSYSLTADSAGNPLKLSTHDRRRSDYVIAKVEGHDVLDGLMIEVQHQGWNFETGHGWLFYIPDLAEGMHEQRVLVSASFRKKVGGLSQEYAARYQTHAIQWNQRYYPNNANASGVLYPGGIWEYLDTSARDVFGRAQLAYETPWGTGLAGVETTVFFYQGDNAHFGNYNPDYSPTANNTMQSVGDWLQWISHKPVTNLGVYGQYSTPKLLNTAFLTLGVRYDDEFFTLNPVDGATADNSRSFSQVSPRAALVVAPTEQVSVKLLAEQAFRAPAPTELFGANTWSLGSSPRTLKPEVIQTLEAALDYRPAGQVSIRADGFITKFDHEIAYSPASNLSANIYSLRTAGFETNIQVGHGPFGGYLNYSLAKRTAETVDSSVGALVLPNSSDTTWAPTHSVNAGLQFHQDRLEASVSGHYQGKALRKASDLVDPAAPSPSFNALRGPVSGTDAVPAWVSLNLHLGYQLAEALKLHLDVLNGLDTTQYLIKTSNFPFDYRAPGRQIYAGIDLRL